MAIDKKVHPVGFEDNPTPNPIATQSSSTEQTNNNNMGNPDQNNYQSTYRTSTEDPLLPPPAYTSNQPAGPYNAQTTYDINRRKRSFRRAIHWTLAALAVLLLWRIFFSSGQGPTGGPYPPSSDGSPTDWAHWSNPVELPRSQWPSSSRGPYLSTTTNFTLDPYSSFFLHAKGGGYGGRVDYVLRESSSGNIEVGVETVYTAVSERDQITVVKMDDKKQGRSGVGIYTDPGRRYWNKGGVDIYVTFSLPRQTTFQVLEGDIDNLSVHFADFSPTSFLNFNLRLGNGALNFEGDITSPEVISVHNNNGRIQGRGRLTARSVEVRSSNGHVDLNEVISETSDIGSTNGRVEGTFHVSKKLALSSDNGAIDAKVYVEGKDEDDAGEKRVDVDATSSNGRVTLTYLKQDPEVLLFSTARADNGHASVRHANTFVGKVEAGTDMGHLQVSPPPPSSAASGPRRQVQSASSKSSSRVWQVTKDHKGMMGHEFYADLYWRDSPDFLGQTIVRSDMGSVDASFD
ncbi:hypothetical protein A4X13_0g4262 [Tilletia indica]|uniref:DUF7330 domain-containing protein n=1 Tax=Tilletia indica TaxID=43049 RepID=A0A177T9K1_9BASI|nr:hypothetical protein A4X13_0g4262 [Tilletia indica]